MIKYKLLTCKRLCNEDISKNPCISNPNMITCKFKDILINNIGVCFGQSGDHSTAETYFIQALNINIKQPFFIYNLSVSLFNRQLFPKAIKTFRMYLDQKENDSLGWHLLGVSFGEIEDYRSAFDCLVKANQFDPKNKKILHDLGICHFKQNNFSQAKKFFEKALENDPSFEKSKFYLTRCFPYVE